MMRMKDNPADFARYARCSGACATWSLEVNSGKELEGFGASADTGPS
jgi:hypothetical protein